MEQRRRSIIDLADILTFGGLAMTGAGLWMVKPWVALVVVGAVFFSLGIWSSLPARRR